MAEVGAAAATAAAAPAAGLAASYAAVQSTLRRQFFGDLVELRGALVNTLNLEPQRAHNLHLKLQLIDAALRMLEETKAEVTSADMASLMNMSAKVVRAVEAWRARRLSARQEDAAAEALPPSLTMQQQQQSMSQQQPLASQQQPSASQQQPSASQQQQSASQQQQQPAPQPQQSASQQQPSASQQQQEEQQLTSQQQQSTSQQQQQQQPQVHAVCVDANGGQRSRITSPFAAPEVQLARADAPTPVLPPAPPTAGAKDATAAAAAAARGDDGPGPPLSSIDQFDFLSKLIVDPADPLRAPAVSLLPDIDWEVPEVKPSGNLDTLLPSEASQVLLAQQRTVAQKRAAARAQRMSSAEAFLARVSANAAAEGSIAAEGPGASGTLASLSSYQQQQSQQGGVPPGLPLGPLSQPPAKQQKQHHPQQPGHHQDDPLAAAMTAARASHCPLTSPQSAATHSPVGASHQEVSSNSGGGSRLSGAAGYATAVGSAGYPATGSTEPSPSGSHQQLPLNQGLQPCPHAGRLNGGYATAGLEPSPFSSAAAQGAVAGPPGQGTGGASISAAPFGSTQLVHPEPGVAAIQQQQQPWLGGGASRSAPAAALPPPLFTTMSAGGASLGFNGGNAHSLQLSGSSGRPGELHTSNPSLVGELKLLGLSSGSLQLGSQALPSHLQTMASYTRHTAAAAQLAAADHQQAERLSALRLLQQFPHAALHGGCGALQQLLSAGDSFGAPGGFSADPTGQLQQVAALQAQQQAAQLAQVAALERYRRDQLQYQQLQQQLMQPFGGFPQLQPQAPAYHQMQFANGGSTQPAGSGGMPGMPVAADGQPFRICPSLAAGASSSGAGGMWQTPNGVLAAGPPVGHMPVTQAGSQQPLHANYGAGAGFGEAASLSSGASSRQKRRRA